YVPSVVIARTARDGADIITKNSYTYSDKGQQLIYLAEVDSGKGYVNYQLDSSFYNASGRTSVQSHYYWKNGGWFFVQKRTYEYDGAGNNTLLISETLTESGWIKFRIVTAYNENGKVVEAVINSVEGDKVTPQQRYSLTYNGKGLVTEMLVEMISNGTPINYSKRIYEYTDDGFMTIEQYSLWKGESFVPYERIEYVPNSSGSVSYYVSWYRNGGSLVKSDSLAFTYFNDGKAATQLNAYWDEKTGWINMNLIEFEYDGLGKESVITRYSWGDSLWLKGQRNTYAYNAKGFLLSAIIENGAEGGEWANFSKTEYAYDAKNNAIKAEYFTWQGSGWINANGSLDMGYTYYHAYLAEASYIAIDGSIGADDGSVNPEEFALGQNYPNPFNPETKISFSLPASGKTSLKVYDMLGREVAELVNGEMEKGTHTINFNGKNLSSGVYIYRLQAGSFTESKKMALIK
ncbi:MAG TPA: T9SS type A sorting domain-containing protein, partial [Ignavibacteriales bacterium]|nr:T9SS type A sorting domain-containing protein [Ignavibacteriales bacterium]